MAITGKERRPRNPPLPPGTRIVGAKESADGVFAHVYVVRGRGKASTGQKSVNPSKSRKR